MSLGRIPTAGIGHAPGNRPERRPLCDGSELFAWATGRTGSLVEVRGLSSRMGLSDARGIGDPGRLTPMGQALCDDPGRLHRRLAQRGVADDIALDAVRLVLQPRLQGLEFVDKPVDLLDGIERYAFHQGADVFCNHVPAVVACLWPLLRRETRRRGRRGITLPLVALIIAVSTLENAHLQRPCCA